MNRPHWNFRILLLVLLRDPIGLLREAAFEVGSWVRRIKSRLFSLFLLFLAPFFLSGSVAVQPTMAAPITHNPTHCSAEFVSQVASGVMRGKYFFSGNWVVASNGALICILQSVGSGVFREVTTYSIVDTPSRTAWQRVEQIAQQKKASEVAGSVVKGAVKKAIPRGLSAADLLALMPRYTLCTFYANDHAWFDSEYRRLCGSNNQ
jgi:hypothetical protein